MKVGKCDIDLINEAVTSEFAIIVSSEINALRFVNNASAI